MSNDLLFNLKVRRKFPMVRRLVYLDTASLALKPKLILKEAKRFYYKFSHLPRDLLIKDQFNFVKLARQKVSNFFNLEEELTIFFSGATEALNQLVSMLKKFLKKGDKILVWAFNHSANIVPWINLANELGLEVIVTEQLEEHLVKDDFRVVTFSQEPNGIGKPLDLLRIYKLCHSKNIFLINDACQAASTEKLTIKTADAIIFSFNKIYGPTGLGVLALSRRLANSLESAKFGGSNIVSISSDLSWKQPTTLYQKFESGTLNLSAIFVIPGVLNFLENLGLDRIKNYILNLAKYAYRKLKVIENIEIFSDSSPKNVIFRLKNWPSAEVANFLAGHGVLVRYGDFCVKYAANLNRPTDLIRISFGIYNNRADVRKLIRLLRAGNFFTL